MTYPADNPDTVVKAAGLTKTFKDFWGRPKARALKGVDFAVTRGQVFGLLGPNGSGKSTTVKIVLGLLFPDRGDVRVLGQSPRDVNTKRLIGYLPEDTYLYNYLTARETLDFFGALFDLDAKERRRRTDQLLDMVGLAQAGDRRVGEFSKGMARRIGLAQALINDPELIILDEPTSGLDPIGCREVKDVIRLLAQRGKTVILSSHLLADVQDVCDEIVVLYGGSVRAKGTLKELLAVQDRTQITAPALEDADIDALLGFLRQHASDQEIEVTRPTMSLERFFLDVVRNAGTENLDTPGAHAGGEIAEYLRTPQIADAVLTSLHGRPQEPHADPDTEQAHPQDHRPLPEETEKRLREALAAPTNRPQISNMPVEKDDDDRTPTPEAPHEASKRLRDLLGPDREE